MLSVGILRNYLTFKIILVVIVRCGASFEVEIVSEQFEGKRLLERHRLVNTALAEQMKQIHALSIKKALTPAQSKPEDKA
jgi:stress-induced morphogen